MAIAVELTYKGLGATVEDYNTILSNADAFEATGMPGQVGNRRRSSTRS
jgi:hypothetical protein